MVPNIPGIPGPPVNSSGSISPSGPPMPSEKAKMVSTSQPGAMLALLKKCKEKVSSGACRLKDLPSCGVWRRVTLIHDSYLLSATFRAWYTGNGSEKKQHRLFGWNSCCFSSRVTDGGWMSGQESWPRVNNCITSPWPGFKNRAFTSGLYKHNNPHPPTVPRMMSEGTGKVF